MTGARLRAVALVLLPAAAVCHGLLYWGVTLDDTYITLRYARNLVEGAGLVYNPGEPPVEGFTSPLNVLLAAAAFLLAGTAYVPLKLTGLAVTVAFILALLRRNVVTGLLAGSILAGSTPYVFYAMSGMEHYLTVPVLFLLLHFTIGPVRETRVAWMATAIVAVLLRPELQAAVGLAAVWRVWRARRDTPGAVPWELAGLGLAIVVVYVTRYAYFGDWLPNTYYAKHSGGTLANTLLSGVRYVAQMTPSMAATITLAVGSITLIRDRSERGFVAAQLLMALAVPVAAGGDDFTTFPHMRLLLPVTGILVFTVHRAGEAAVRPWLPVATLLPLLAVWPAASWLRQPGQPGLTTFTETRPGAFTDYLTAQTPPGAHVAMPWAGYIPFATRLPVIDTLGLTDRHIAREAKRDFGVDVKFDAEYLLERRPYFYCDNFRLDPASGLDEVARLSRAELKHLGSLRQGQQDLLRDPRLTAGYRIDPVATALLNGLGTCLRRVN